MSRVMDEAEELNFSTAAEWRAWLATHHARPTGVWLVQYKASTGKPNIPYEDAVCEALCFGWIDSTYRRIDHERGALWWSPRRKGSLWARTNKARVERLEADGRMTEAGRAVIERARADGSWSTLEPVEALIVPDDLAAAMERVPGASDAWEPLPATAKQAYLLWVYNAKRDATRLRRVQETAARVAQGLRLEDR
jgi:uncharacterized protein YdeI (YjbR/CyaY-like superfamily)